MGTRSLNELSSTSIVQQSTRQHPPISKFVLYLESPVESATPASNRVIHNLALPHQPLSYQPITVARSMSTPSERTFSQSSDTKRDSTSISSSSGHATPQTSASEQERKSSFGQAIPNFYLTTKRTLRSRRRKMSRSRRGRRSMNGL